jgi:hypothetical protein
MNLRTRTSSGSNSHGGHLTFVVNSNPRSGRLVEAIFLPKITDYWDQRSCHLQRLCEIVKSWNGEQAREFFLSIEQAVTEHAEVLTNRQIALAAVSMVEDVYKAISVGSDCSEVVMQYLDASAGALSRKLRERGYQLHYLVDNTFQEYGGPVQMFGRYFRAAGLQYVCPQETALSPMGRRAALYRLPREKRISASKDNQGPNSGQSVVDRR